MGGILAFLGLWVFFKGYGYYQYPTPWPKSEEAKGKILGQKYIFIGVLMIGGGAIFDFVLWPLLVHG